MVSQAKADNLTGASYEAITEFSYSFVLSPNLALQSACNTSFIQTEQPNMATPW